jgi:diadenosine tetraphosphate (Ap4A) HIT family hydrolase
MAEIHPRLAADCILLGRFPLSHLLLMDDSNYPWFILVPDREGIGEIYQLDDRDRSRLLLESCTLAEFLMQSFAGDKLNLGALGNQVPQLHIHHIVRYASDPAWPAPVWGRYPPAPYTADAVADIRARISTAGLADFQAA